MSVDNKLNEIQKMWDETNAKSIYALSDGDYITQLTSMVVGESKNGRLQVVSTFKVIEGPYEGKETLRFDGIDNPMSIGFFKGMCEAIGLVIADPLTLQADMDRFLDDFKETVEIKLKTTTSPKGEFQNLYITRLGYIA